MQQKLSQRCQLSILQENFLNMKKYSCNLLILHTLLAFFFLILTIPILSFLLPRIFYQINILYPLHVNIYVFETYTK